MKITKKQLEQIDMVLGYIYNDEKKNYEEYVFNGGDKKNHIFTVINSLAKSLKLD